MSFTSNYRRLLASSAPALVLLTAAFSVANTAHAGAVDLSGVGGAYTVPVRSLAEARFAATNRQQYDFSCGSAAVATLLTHHYGYPITEQIVFEEMYQHGNQAKIRREGFSLLDIKRFLESRGFQADGFQQSIDKLVEAKVPALVLVSENRYHHFVVVKGMQDGRILIGDPSSGTRSISKENFESIWLNKLLFVIHNKTELARFNEKTDWRVAPRAPLGNAVNRGGLDNVTIPKLGPGDF